MNLALLLLASTAVSQQPPPQLAPDDRIRLAEVRLLARTIQDSVWPEWHTAPFAVLLVTDSVEFLLWHPRPSAEFRPLGYDSLLATEVLSRPRTFAPSLLATFPAVGGVSTIVVGQPAKTGKGSTAWVLTLLHEHFHQLQTSRAGYYAAVDSLQLSGGDQTGMWMLNYPFPYDSAPVQRRFTALAQALAAALDDSAGASAAAVRRYAATRRDLLAGLADPDVRYLEFQLWQEGVARYVEYACARIAARAHTPTAAFAALPDYVSYGEAASRLRSTLLRELRASDLGASKRVNFYSLGGATALLLDRLTPGWKPGYLARLLTLDPEIAALEARYRAEFAAMQDRGHAVMGVDQYTSAHVFEDLADGGRVVLDRDDATDTAAVAAIRRHMRDIADAFRAGDFTKPFQVHAQDVPGTAVMAARRDRITYEAQDRPRGGEVRIRTTDPTAIEAVHAFLAFQRSAHHAAGHGP